MGVLLHSNGVYYGLTSESVLLMTNLMVRLLFGSWPESWPNNLVEAVMDPIIHGLSILSLPCIVRRTDS